MQTLASTSPVDGQPLEPLAPNTAVDAGRACDQARRVQPAWAALPHYERIRAVFPVKTRLLSQADAIAESIHREIGRPKVEALLSEVLPTADVIDYWAEVIGDALRERDVALDGISYPGKRARVAKEARGVVGLISPWNFPLALPMRTIVPALLAGNTVVFKASEWAPRVALEIAKLFEGLPEGVLQVLVGGGDVGAAMIEAGVDVVAFTGSVATGKVVARACAERLVPCVLELGGKDAAIVLDDARLDRTAHGIVWGAMMNAGQNCAGIERVYVVRSVADALLSRVVKEVEALRVGEDVGPLIHEEQRALVESQLADACHAGAQILTGGMPHGTSGLSPVVVRVETEATKLISDETFGPVLPIRVVEDEAQAIALANDSRFGLTASVWTRSLERGERVARQLRAGVVTVNNHAFTGAIPSLPWSGSRDSGYGITNSLLTLDALTRPRVLVVDRSRGNDLWWFPYSPSLESIARAMSVLKNPGAGLWGKIKAVFSLLSAFPRRLRGK